MVKYKNLINIISDNKLQIACNNGLGIYRQDKLFYILGIIIFF